MGSGLEQCVNFDNDSPDDAKVHLYYLAEEVNFNILEELWKGQ